MYKIFPVNLAYT